MLVMAGVGGGDSDGEGVDGEIDGETGGDGEFVSKPGAKIGCSFTPNTPVLMANGSAKPIKDVKVGDKVTTTDPSPELDIV